MPSIDETRDLVDETKAMNIPNNARYFKDNLRIAISFPVTCKNEAPPRPLIRCHSSEESPYSHPRAGVSRSATSVRDGSRNHTTGSRVYQLRDLVQPAHALKLHCEGVSAIYSHTP